MIDLNDGNNLKNLIRLVLKKEVDICYFCEKFEQLYNLKLNKKNLSEKEKLVLEVLFNKVVYYSPFADEREFIPNYLNEDEIFESAKKAWNDLYGSGWTLH